MKIFIPFSEALIEELGLSIGELVPFQLEYECLRMNETRVGGDCVPEYSWQTDFPDHSRTESAPTIAGEGAIVSR